MLNETAITFAALEQVANAAGLDLALAKTTHTKGASKSTPPRFGDQSPHTIAYAAIGPMFRELASTFTDAKIPAKGLSEGEALFSTYFQSELQPGRGQPSLFRRCCEALSIKDDDAPWIFSVVIVSLLRGVVTKYTEHLVDVNDDSTDFESSDEEDVSRDERIARENFGMIGSMAAAFANASPAHTTQVKSDRSDQGNVKDAELKALIRNGRWQSHYSASQQVWEDVALALTLRRGEDVTSRWIENALKQTAEQRRGVRLRALAKLRKNRDDLKMDRPASTA